MISPNVMALALKYKGWKEGYRWTAYIQIAILVVCLATLGLWKNDKDDSSKKIDEKNSDQKEVDKKEEDNKEEHKKDDDMKEEEEKGKDMKKEIEQSSNKMIKVNMIKVEKKMNKKDRIDTDEELTKRDDKEEKETELDEKKVLSICDVLKIKGVAFSCIAFFAYCSGEGTCFLWTSSFFDGTKEGLSKDAVASLSTTIFGGLMLGRVLSGLVSEKLGDKKLIRIGLIIEIIGIICVGIPIKTYVLAIIGYCLTSIGMGPIYPSIQHLVPILFGKEASPTIIGLQMASAYLGTTLMPFVFGLIQSKTSMWAHPIYIGVFAILNCIFIEIEFKLCDNNNNNENEENKEDNDKKENEDNKKNEGIQINK
jgi:Na+/melibiose symporter-like transporter